MTQPNSLASPPQQGNITTTTTPSTLSTKSIVRNDDRLACGTVCIWNCAGELYGIECALCDDRPLYTLSEFADHMEVWHRAWSRQMREHTLSVQSTDLTDVHEDLIQEVLAELRATGEIELITSPESSAELLAEHMRVDDVDELAHENALETEMEAQTQEDNQCFDSMLTDMEIELDCADIKLKASPAPEPFEEFVWLDKLDVQEPKVSMQQSEVDAEFQLPEAGRESEKCKSRKAKSKRTKKPKKNASKRAFKKLTAQHVSKLIELYKSQPCLWNQSHAEFGDTELGRQAWQAITKAWSKYCRRNFSMTDVRIRISTLCQRFMKQRERLEAEGELDECTRFVHYESLTFLVEQQTLQNRRQLFENDNRKLLAIYQRYPVLWHTGHRSVRSTNERTVAYHAISVELKALGINLTSFGVQRRVMSLRKCYRVEKIRYLHSLVEGGQNGVLTVSAKEFVSDFKHYRDMAFLHKHIDPYVCAGCGKISENLVTHREHVNNWKMSCWQAYDMCADEDELPSKDEEEERKYMPNDAEEVIAVEPSTALATTTTTESPTAIATQNGQTEFFNGDVNEVATSELSKQPLVVKVQCEQFSYDLHLCANMTASEQAQQQQGDMLEEKADHEAGSDESDVSSGIGDVDMYETLTSNHENFDEEEEKENNNDNNNNNNSDEEYLPHISHKDRLSGSQTHKLIALYKSQPTLWDPNHLDFHSRKQRRLIWQTLTAALNSSCETDYSWQILHRKMTDYTKYYKREKQRIADPLGARSKWYFYKHFRFLDDALVVSNELQKTLQQRDNNLKIIDVYKEHPQLWCTDHPDYSKRKHRPRCIEAMCTRLQEECNLQITPDRLKTRLIEFRCQYRLAKQQRMDAEHAGDAADWQPGYEYYDVLKFLEKHVSPFVCTRCGESFKRFTEYLQHERNVHEETLNDGGVVLQQSAPPIDGGWARQLCHICGLMFSMRNSLLAHLKRHLGERNFACTTCPKKFYNSTALDVHTRSHTKELPYVCEHCARGFVNSSKLNQHVKRHRNQRDFNCNRCEKTFYTAYERERHLRSHLNIRDKICPICGRAFVVGSAYYAHLNLHRDNKRYCCDYCGLRFSQYAGLYKHRKRCNRAELTHDE